MLNGCEVHVAFTGDAEQALISIAGELKKLGYVDEKRDDGALKMSFKGKWFTKDPAKMKHTVKVTPSADKLSFAFGTGIIASHWTDEDKKWAQGRADEVVAAVQSQ